jgi:hypothetical protein
MCSATPLLPPYVCLHGMLRGSPYFYRNTPQTWMHSKPFLGRLPFAAEITAQVPAATTTPSTSTDTAKRQNGFPLSTSVGIFRSCL